METIVQICNGSASVFQTVMCVCSLPLSDVNECEETNGGCEALCCNTIGSFYCKCPAGHELKEDGKTCQGESRLFSLGFSVPFMLFQKSCFI